MIEDFENQILAWFAHFHAHPEVSWKEVKTTEKIEEILKEELQSVSTSSKDRSNSQSLIKRIF